MCYYVNISISFGINSGERTCYGIHPNSTLVGLDIQERGNINSTKFLGRRFDDLLLEFLYYYLENRLLNQTKTELNRKNWLKLLLRNKHVPSECILKYFERAPGTFTSLYQCHNGGYAVCQIEPIQTFIPISTTTQTIPTTEPTTTTTTTSVTIADSTICENCTIDYSPLPTTTNFTEKNSTIKTKKKSFIYQPLLLILTGPILAFILLAFAILFLIRFLRQNHGSYSTHSSLAGSHRTRRSSTAVTNADMPGSGLLQDVNTPRVSLFETELLLPTENLLITNDETIELLPVNDQDELKEKQVSNGID